MPSGKEIIDEIEKQRKLLKDNFLDTLGVRKDVEGAPKVVTRIIVPQEKYAEWVQAVQPPAPPAGDDPPGVIATPSLGYMDLLGIFVEPNPYVVDHALIMSYTEIIAIVDLKK